MDNDKKNLYRAALLALWPVVCVWMVFAADNVFSLHLSRFGLIPADPAGLYGVCTVGLLHKDIDHLISNTSPLFLLVFGLYFLYERKAWAILLSLYLVSGFTTWCMGRYGTTHVGASGLIYALAAFHFASGLIRRVPSQLAFALLVAFLYGGFVWAFFPALYRYTSISWEGHLSGLLTGMALAFYYRRYGPPMPVYDFMLEDDDDEAEKMENGGL